MAMNRSSQIDAIVLDFRKALIQFLTRGLLLSAVKKITLSSPRPCHLKIFTRFAWSMASESDCSPEMKAKSNIALQILVPSVMFFVCQRVIFSSSLYIFLSKAFHFGWAIALAHHRSCKPRAPYVINRTPCEWWNHKQNTWKHSFVGLSSLVSP